MWVVTVHDGGGSMVEAADPRFAALMPTEQGASGLADAINNELARQHRDEWWCIWYPILPARRIDWPKATAAQLQMLGQPPKGTETAIDVATLVEKLIEGEEIGALPEPPNDDELAAAIKSITG